ncbi:2-amino-4-hydroxy-6-hydroxymethyldihydropteridine diphosphokinase [Roseobacteraceae bacterium S113]
MPKKDAKKSVFAVVALGSNLPAGARTPKQTLNAAIIALVEKGVAIRAISRFFETPCFPAGAGPDYVNAAISLDWTGTPEALLAVLHEVEAAFARTREVRWGQRTLDLDLIAFGNHVRPSPEAHARWRNLPLEVQMREAPGELILPHPRVQDRAFVLVPMADIAPDWHHPILDQTTAALCAALPEDARAEVTPL